jgi:hypothetical protein
MHVAPFVKASALVYAGGMRRLTASALLVVLAAWLGSCRGDTPKAGPSPELVARIDKLQEEEGGVLARRDEISRERQKVDADRALLEEKRKAATQTGGDPGALDAESRALAAREARIAADEAKLGRELDGVLRTYQQLATGAAGKDVAGREAQVAMRERDFSRREQIVAEREATLAARERELARRERETCSVPAAVAAPAPAPVPGARYSRKDVEPLLTGARRKMSDKGLLPSDLPSPATDLEREAASAMGAGDWSRARFAADQLVATVDSLKIDKPFIMAKIGRLNGTVKGMKLPEDARKQVDDLFRDATADYGDGKFASANGKLNRIYGLLR